MKYVRFKCVVILLSAFILCKYNFIFILVLLSILDRVMISIIMYCMYCYLMGAWTHDLPQCWPGYVVGDAICWSDVHYSISLRYTRNIVQLNSFYIKFESHYFLYLYNKYHNLLKNFTIKICHSRRYNIVTQSCALRIRELLRYLVIRDIMFINETCQLVIV